MKGAISLLATLIVAATVHAQSPLSFEQYTGWYEISPGRHSLVTWGASGGLRIFDFDTPGFEALKSIEGNKFLWRRGEDALNRDVVFITNEGKAMELRWRGRDGSEGVARKSAVYGYLQEEVQFKNGNLTLTGTLMIPRSKGGHPAAAFIHGSGDSDRDNVWAFSIANHLALNGVAVLLADKRGSGKSEGDWRKAGFSELASDALAAVQALRNRKEVDAKRVGIVGLSQGGWIAPLAASRDKRIAFVIDVSGSAVTPGEQVAHELEQDFRRAGLQEKVIQELLALLKLYARYIRTAQGWDEYRAAYDKVWPPFRKAFPAAQDDWRIGWWKPVIDFDPIPLWRKLQIPVLIVYGEDDEKDNVPVKESVARLEKARAAKRGGDITIKVYPDSGHAIDDPKTKWIRRDFLEFLARWSLDQTKP